MSWDKARTIDQLSSPSSIDRLRAARALDVHGVDAVDVTLVRSALEREHDSWVRSALERVLAHHAGAQAGRDFQPPVDEIGTVTDARTLDDVRAQAIASVTSVLLHEIRPHVGFIDAAAAREVPDYEGSRTARALEKLRSMLTTVQRLNDAARPPEPADFDLTAAIVACADAMVPPDRRVFLGRSDPVIALGDWGLLEIAFINALRNALEAAEPTGGRVVVNWGATDSDYWIAVIDEGVGLPQGRDIFEPGFTLKSRETNSGWGLAIALQAIRSVGGDLALRPREPHGAACEIRWARTGVTP